MRVFFACFMGWVILGVLYSMGNHPTRSIAFCVVVAIFAFLTVCSIITYFRPRGLAAFFTSSAYVGLIMISGLVEVPHITSFLSGQLGAVVALLIMVVWLLTGIKIVREAREEEEAMDRAPAEAADPAHPREVVQDEE